ncbi:MAG: hypothetical protein GKR88_18775 [Flavobacteriaceae bacterium]|nr:MAG: hypothetical protein GKR88_18775 [Flavobacteriaceae bacterium]
MSNTDATPSWSGYIFQGEVALCKALEEMNQLDSINDTYCLKLEQEEDFSLTTNELHVFQVKAYTAHNYSKYKKAWNDMMNRFQDNRENNYLYLQLDGVELDKFNGVQNIEQVSTNIISGEYTLSNINSKINLAIKNFINNPDITDDDIEIKRIYCCQIISDYVKQRHKNKEVREIPFAEIIRWIEKAPLAFNEKIAWFEIEKVFIKSFYEELNVFDDLTNEQQRNQYEKLQSLLYEIEQMTTKEIIDLINIYLIPHKILKPPLRTSIITFLDNNAIKNIIGRAIRRINSNPEDYKKLQYLNKRANLNETYQLTLDNSEFDGSDEFELNKLQKHCEILYKTTNSVDVDYFVTQHLDISKVEMKERINNIIDVNEDSQLNISDVENNNLFGLKSINKSINELNQ